MAPQQLLVELSLIVRCVTEKAEHDLAKSRAEYDRMTKEKDLMIETLTLKVNTMCVQFETLFHVSVLKYCYA